MPTATLLNNSTQNIESIVGQLPHYGQKSVTAIQKVICITTNDESFENSKELLTDIAKIKEQLPTEVDVDTNQLILQSKQVNKLLQLVQTVLDAIQNLFDSENAKILIDDETMIDFMNNLSTAKEQLLHISDCITLVTQVQKSKEDIKNGKFHKFTLEQLLSHLNAANISDV